MSALTTPPVPTPAAEATRAELLATLTAGKAAAESALAVVCAERDEARELVEHWKATAEAEADIGNERQAEAAIERARAERAEKRIGTLEALVDRLDDEALAIIQRQNRYSGLAWMKGADHGAKHVACDVRSTIRAGDPELGDRAIRHAALTRPDDRTTTEVSEHAPE